jgi:hypothetical protein
MATESLRCPTSAWLVGQRSDSVANVLMQHGPILFGNRGRERPSIIRPNGRP